MALGQRATVILVDNYKPLTQNETNIADVLCV